MVFAAVFAGGTGSRSGLDLPKQYANLCGTPVIIRTTQKFISHAEIDKVIVLCPKLWIEHTKKLFAEHFGVRGSIDIVAGGETRTATLECLLKHIDENYPSSEEGILLTHDAVRPFVNSRIISENIAAVKAFGACDTAVFTTDTIVESGGDFIEAVPPRSRLFNGQTPQSFSLEKLKKTFASLSENEKEALTDACSIFVLRNEPVKIVMGEAHNIKITYPLDFALAKAILEEGIDSD